MTDLEWIDCEHVVLEVDTDRLTSRPVGLIAKPENIRHVAKHVDSERALVHNRAVRLKDLVNLQQIAYKSGRHIDTVLELRRRHPEGWPKPVRKWGNTKIYYWPDVASWFQQHGLRVRLEGHKPPGPKRKASLQEQVG